MQPLDQKGEFPLSTNPTALMMDDEIKKEN
jgi:hypothetical protein